MFEGLEHLYSSFILRDFKFLLVGGFPLAYILRRSEDSFHISSIVNSHPAMFVTFFLATAYICGVGLFHVFTYRTTIWKRKGIAIIVMHAGHWAGNQSEYEAAEVDLINRSGRIPNKMMQRRLERLIAIKELNASIVVIVVTMTILVMCLPLHVRGFASTDAVWRLKLTVPCAVGSVIAVYSFLTHRSKARAQLALLNEWAVTQP